MSTDEMHESSSSREEADIVAQLMQTAGRRQAPPAEAYEQTLRIATAAWERKSRRHRERRLLRWAAAFLPLLAGIAWLLADRPAGPDQAIAELDRVIGSAQIAADSGRDWTPLEQTTYQLSAGSRLRTRDGSRIGLLLASGTSLRLAERTEIELESVSRIRVVIGRVYLDTTGAGSGATPVEVVTALGIASDIGTQFEVQYLDDRYRLRVRDGEVQLRREAASGALRSRAGEQLVIDADGSIARSSIAADDAAWQWVESVASAPDIDDQPLTTLLEWVRRETGRSIRYAEPGLEHLAARTILHGNIRHLAPLDALSVMLAATDFEYAIAEDGTILIRSKANRPRQP